LCTPSSYPDYKLSGESCPVRAARRPGPTGDTTLDAKRAIYQPAPILNPRPREVELYPSVTPQTRHPRVHTDHIAL